MPTCFLHLLIDPEDLRAIQATNRTIVVAKPVNDPQVPNVAWQSITPRTDNVVSWSDTYGIYAANTRLVHGAQILPTQSQPYPALPAHAYTFHADATFHGPAPRAGSGGQQQFCVRNQVALVHYPSLLFGLTQSAIINDLPTPAIPLNAQSVAASQAALFTPINSAYVWLQAGVTPGTIVTQVPEAVTVVHFGRFLTAQTLKYAAAQDVFLPYSQVKQGFSLTLPHVWWPGFHRPAAPVS